jgi:hypothetical protein
MSRSFPAVTSELMDSVALPQTALRLFVHHI